MSYQLKVIKDYPIAFWPLDESSGSVASDISGCGNNGVYHGSPATNILPLVPGGVSGTNITNTAYVDFPISKDYYGASSSNAFGNKYSSDNDFSLEVWIHQSIELNNETPLFADTTNNVGIFWDNGDIVFRVSADNEIRHRVTYSQKVLHIVGVYSVSSITLYVDGKPMAISQLPSGFKFTNTTLTLSAGPTLNTTDSFVIDAPAIYRYSISPSSVMRHYNDGNISAEAIHVAYPEEGILFSGTDARVRSSFEYTYPVNKPWTQFLDDNTYYDSQNGYISFYKTDTAQSKQFIINDSFSIPTALGLISSKVEWRNDLNITVESSVDGINYVSCVNGDPLPQYTKDAFNASPKVYIRITMTSADTSKYLPRLEFFCVSFYNNKDLYADNYGDKLYSATEYSLGSLNYPILSRTYNNGIRAKSGAGFNIATKQAVKSIELFFTPATLNANTLVYAPASGSYALGKYAWNGSGTVSKTNVSKIYINGIDRTSQTNVTNFLTAEEPHHIVIVFTNPVSDVIQFNYQSSGGPNNLYKNIALYEIELLQATVSEHFNLYTGKPSVSLVEPAITLTESSVNYYNNDWIVVQSK